MKKELKQKANFNLDTCPSKVNRRKSKQSAIHKILNLTALISLVIAFAYGFVLQNGSYKEMLMPFLDGKTTNLVSSKPNLYEVLNDKNELLSYCGIQEQIGYGGPMTIATEVNLNGEIINVFTLDHKETQSFYVKLINNNFFDQFIGMNVNSLFLPEKDIDVVSGATISSVAFTKTIELTSYFAGRNYLGFNIPEKLTKWKFGKNEIGLILLFAFAFLAVYKKKKILTSISLGISFMFLGFYLNASLSITSFGSVLLGYLPDFKQHLIWWLLVGVSISSAVILKKNVYCSNMCPFHAAQKGLVLISGMKFRLPIKIQQIAKHTSKFLLWGCLMLIFISSNPTLSSFEPFAIFFSLEGIGIQWYILPATLIGSIFISDFFCKYFCPVGRTFTYIIKFRKSVDLLYQSLVTAKK